MAMPRKRKSSRPGTRRRPATSEASIPAASSAPAIRMSCPSARTGAYDVIRENRSHRRYHRERMQSWAEHADRRLSEAGFRRGGARAAVIALLDRQACALSAYDIEDALRDDGRRVARASVYRVLDELVGLALVTRVDVGQGSTRYE